MIYEKKGVDYDVYVFRQGRKVNNIRKRLLTSIPKRTRKFERILKQSQSYLRPGKILCLGARTGCEVQAAINTGFKGSIGIDLHPAVSDSKLVRKGDWHNIPFLENSFENVFTNSIDHCFDVEKLANEVKRVLKPSGCFYFMLSGKQFLDTKKDAKEYMLKSSNYLFWSTEKDLIQKFEKFGFTLSQNWRMGRNWQNIIMLNKGR